MRLISERDDRGEQVPTAVGRILKAVSWDKERITLRFTTGSDIIGIPQGDCCADAYIAEVAGHESACGSTLFGIEQVAYSLGHQVVDACSQRDIVTTILRCKSSDVLVLVNVDHNGYYSGWIDWYLDGQEG